MTLDISYMTNCPRYDSLFEQCLEVVTSLSAEPFLETETSLVVVIPEYIRTLNRQYRDKDMVTDVLSFHQWDSLSDIFPGCILGEVFLCYDRAEEQAAQLNHSVAEELATLCVHGFWHLQGHDHITEEDHQRMKAKEEQSMTLLRQRNLF